MFNRNRSFLLLTLVLFFAVASLVPGSGWARGATSRPAQSHKSSPAPTQRYTRVALVKEVRHVLVMQPFYTVFDQFEFKVHGEAITLMGQVVRPVLKSDAASAVKHLDGVTSVKNEIKVLPPSPIDDRIRLQEFRAIYSAPGFEKYAIQAVPPIHIIVDMSRVSLYGVVDSQADKIVADLRAKQVPQVLSVTDHLRVVNHHPGAMGHPTTII